MSLIHSFFNILDKFPQHILISPDNNDSLSQRSHFYGHSIECFISEL